MPNLQIYAQMYPLLEGPSRFRIVETVVTVDGFRSRLTGHAYFTMEEALLAIKQLTEVEEKC